MIPFELIPTPGESISDLIIRTKFYVLRNFGSPQDIIDTPEGVPCTAKRYYDFVSYLKEVRTCWIWSGAKTHNGYGQFTIGGRAGRHMRIHRLAHLFWRGPIEEGMQCLHTCDNRACAYIGHLFEGTPTENTQDMMIKGRHKFEVRNRVVTRDLVNKMISLRCKGFFNVRIGKELGISHETVRVYLSGEQNVL